MRLRARMRIVDLEGKSNFTDLSKLVTRFDGLGSFHAPLPSRRNRQCRTG
jgi:hypothetical protein